jgi:hypothetical protein
MKNFLLLTFAACCLSTFSLPADAARQDGLDPRPIDSAVDPDIDLFINDWRKAKSRKLYGSLLVQDILTPLEGGDPLRPKKKGAVLVGITAISRATLAPAGVRSAASVRFSIPRAAKGSSLSTVPLIRYAREQALR